VDTTSERIAPIIANPRATVLNVSNIGKFMPKAAEDILFFNHFPLRGRRCEQWA